MASKSASASTSTSTSVSASASTSASSSASPAMSTTTASSLQLSANFAGAHSKSPNAVGYDHETYLQLTAGGKPIEKTPNQVYQAERALRRTTRALDRAISDPQGDPSPIDFECAEFQAKRDW